MEWNELRVQILAHRPDPGDLVYLGRRGTSYSWTVLADGAEPPQASRTPPDAWIYYSGRWPVDQPWPHAH